MPRLKDCKRCGRTLARWHDHVKCDECQVLPPPSLWPLPFGIPIAEAWPTKSNVNPPVGGSGQAKGRDR